MMKLSSEEGFSSLAVALALIVSGGFTSEARAETSVIAMSPDVHSCMEKFWAGLLPFLVDNRGYIDKADLERMAAIKLQKVVRLSDTGTIWTYETRAHTAADFNVPWMFSVRFELQNEPWSFKPGELRYSWQVAQGRASSYGGAVSILDFTCMSSGELTLNKVEADLKVAGYQLVGKVSGLGRSEIFAGPQGGEVAVYYEMPVESAPAVVSLHVVGMRPMRRNLAAAGL